MKRFLLLGILAAAPFVLAAQAFPAAAFAQSTTPVPGAPRKQDPKVAQFHPGDLYVTCSNFGPSGPGAVLRLDPLTGAATSLVTLDTTSKDSVFDHDKSLDRLVLWARPQGFTSNNLGFVLLFVEPSGEWSFIDLPPGALNGLTCTGGGRTYFNIGVTIYYIDGMDPSATIHTLMDSTGIVPFTSSDTLGNQLDGMVYDEDLNCLVFLYTASSPFAQCPGVVSAGIHVLPLSPDGTQVAVAPPENKTLFWNSPDPTCTGFEGGSLTRLPDGSYMVDVIFRLQNSGNPLFGNRFESMTIDPVTLTPNPPTYFAEFFGCSWHKLDATGFSWKHGLMVGTDNFHNFQPGGLHLFPPGPPGCGIMLPGPYLSGGIRFVAIDP